MKSLFNQRGSVLLGLALLFVNPLRAQSDFDPLTDVNLETRIVPSQVSTGGSGNLIADIGLPENMHITSLDLGFFFVEPEAVDGITWQEPVFPPGIVFQGDTVYKGQVEVVVPFTLTGDFNPGDLVDIKGVVGYQICTETDPIFCTPPSERNFQTVLGITKGEISTSAVETGGESGLTIEERARRALERGSLMALIWVFIGGVLLSLTPCVYPIIPITIAFIGARSGGSKLKGLSLSLVFVLGLALVYSILGVIAAATGGVFGLSTQNPWVIGFVTVIFLVMGAGMMGAFEIALPSSLQTKLSSGKRSGYLGALFVGATTGLIAAPCVGPVLVALLSWVSSTGNIIHGFIYLFVFACGLGVLFVVIGTFAGVVTALPKAGKWMEKIKHGFGVILIAAAFYFGQSLVSDNLFTILIGLGLLMLTGFLGGFSRLEAGASIGSKIGRGIAFFIMLTGAFYLLLGLVRFEGIDLIPASMISDGAGSESGYSDKSHKVKWIYDDRTKAFDLAREKNKLLMIDFWADWCAACIELDHKTFSNPKVYNTINQDFIPLKIDGSNITDELKSIWAEYGVRGLPTVLFLTPDGEELERFEAFRNVDQVMQVLERVKGN
ncbi:thioredoxin family protein [bacterium]|nr:thioredoxin family protein [bacterium]